MNGYDDQVRSLQSNGLSRQRDAASSNLRLPTVEEAMTYSPFTSIVPFNPGLIPAPGTAQKLSPAIFGDPLEQKTARDILEQLNTSANGAEAASQRCRQTLRDVSRLLNSDDLMQFVFNPNKSAGQSNGTAKISPQRKAQLSPFAKMVLEKANIPYRYADFKSSTTAGKAIGKTKRDPTSHVKPETPISNGFKSGAPSVSAVISDSITPDERAKYQFYADPDPTTSHQYDLSPSKQRSKLTNGARHVSVDQKHRNDTAVSNLQTLLHTIIETEDMLLGGMNGGEASDGSAMFETRDTDEGAVLVLHPDRMKALDSHYNKVASAQRLSDISIEDHDRVQKLCERAIAPVQSMPLSIDEDWSDSDIEEWLVKVSHAETGLTAALTTMRIMAGQPDSKALQSESLLQQVLTALDNIIGQFIIQLVEMLSYIGEKIRGQKEEPPANPKFTIASTHRRPLQSLLSAATKALRAVGVLLVETKFEESNISKVESLCETLIFAQNASNDKDSVLGVQNFETTRRCAMDVLTKIFTKYPDQRNYIFNEILSSLSKLPATKQSARQYRLADAKPIQLVSALLMRLVQTSGCVSASDQKNFSDQDDEDGEGFSDEELKSTILMLNKAAQDHAAYVARQLVDRASNTSKTGDEPYRKLLDIFIDDFLNVLGSNEWPAAEQLLYSLLAAMVRMAEDLKKPAPARTMALEYLGVMGSGILEAQMSARNSARSIDEESHHGHLLAELVDQAESSPLDTDSVTSLGGPYRIILEHLESHSGDEDTQALTARGYRLTEWFSIVCGARASSVDSDASNDGMAHNDLQTTLIKMVRDPHWLSEHTQANTISPSDARLASKVLTLNSKYCRNLNRILHTLFMSLRSEQPTVRSRGLKSVDIIIEKDPSVLERNPDVLQTISNRLGDSSPLVRDSALGLLSNCLLLRPKLDSTQYHFIVNRTGDNASGVRQRAIKILKDIFLRNDSTEMRSTIARAVLSKIVDPEEKVVDLARNTAEEMLFQPFYSYSDTETPEAKRAYGDLATLIVKMLDKNEHLIDVVDALLRRLQRRSKAASSVSKVCKTLIKRLFDDFVEGKRPEDSGADAAEDSTEEHTLMALTVFAKSCPKLFNAPQLERLAPYLDNLTSHSDLWTCRFAIIVLRHTLPHQTHLILKTAKEVYPKLLRVLSKAPVSELQGLAEEVASCVWTINGITGEGNDRLANFVASAIKGLSSLANDDLNANPQNAIKASRLSCIIGEFGKACDLSSSLSAMKAQFSWFRGDSVPGLMVELLCRFTSPKRPLNVRVAAIAAICSISQSWSEQFLREDVMNAFEMVFQEQDTELETALLGGLEVFFGAQEKPKYDDDEDEKEEGKGIASGKDRLGRTYQASDDDKALTSMSQRFLDHIRRLALAASNDAAFIAARLIITINSQGLGHPKDSAPALVALETSPNAAIAKAAFSAHKDQGLSRESVFEKEYMRGVQLAFEYQKEVVGEVIGYTSQPPTAKLHCLWDVLKNGKAGVRNKFLGNLSRKLDFDLDSITQQHVSFVYFCLGNLAFFDYDKIDELLGLVASLEKVFSATGTNIAHAIENEVLNLEVENIIDAATIDIGMDMPLQQPQSSIDPQRLHTLALGGQTLSMIWETRSFLRRLYSLQKHANKAKKAGKDGAAKNAYRAPNAPSLNEAHQQRSRELVASLDTEERQRAMCSSFVELFNVDREVKVGSEDDLAEDAENEYATPSEDGSGTRGSVPPGTSGAARGKKRRSSNQASTPRKRGRPSLNKRKSVSFNRGGSDDEDDDVDDDGGDWI